MSALALLFGASACGGDFQAREAARHPPGAGDAGDAGVGANGSGDGRSPDAGPDAETDGDGVSEADDGRGEDDCLASGGQGAGCGEGEDSPRAPQCVERALPPAAPTPSLDLACDLGERTRAISDGSGNHALGISVLGGGGYGQRRFAVIDADGTKQGELTSNPVLGLWPRSEGFVALSCIATGGCWAVVEAFSADGARVRQHDLALIDAPLPPPTGARHPGVGLGIAWLERDGDAVSLELQRFDEDARALGEAAPAARFELDALPTGLSVAVDASGALLATWAEAHGAIRGVWLEPGEEPGEPFTLALPGALEAPRLAALATGGVALHIEGGWRSWVGPLAKTPREAPVWLLDRTEPNLALTSDGRHLLQPSYDAALVSGAYVADVGPERCQVFQLEGLEALTSVNRLSWPLGVGPRGTLTRAVEGADGGCGAELWELPRP